MSSSSNPKNTNPPPLIGFKISSSKKTANTNISSPPPAKKPAKLSSQFDRIESPQTPEGNTLLSISKNGIFEVPPVATTPENLIIPCKHPLPIPKLTSTYSTPHYITLDTPLGKDPEVAGPSDLHSKIHTQPNSASSSASMAHNSKYHISPEEEQAKLQSDIPEEDRIAAEALLKEVRGETSSTGVTPILAHNTMLTELRRSGLSEDLLLKKEVEMLPEMKSDDYENVPIKDFGMAMLLGMGYDPNKHTARPLELKQRTYQRAGLGADKAIEEDIMAARESTKKEIPRKATKNNNEKVNSIMNSQQTPNPPKHDNDLNSSQSKAQVNKFDLTGSNKPKSDDKLPPNYWVQHGLYVKIASPDSNKYKHKGIIVDVKLKNGRALCKLDLSQRPPPYQATDPYYKATSIMQHQKDPIVWEYAEDLESTINRSSVYAKCVGKRFSAYGQVVKVDHVDKSKDYVEFHKLDNKGHSTGSRYRGVLDDLCEFAHMD